MLVHEGFGVPAWSSVSGRASSGPSDGDWLVPDEAAERGGKPETWTHVS